MTCQNTIAVLAAVSLALIGCNRLPTERPIGRTAHISSPLGLPPLPVPANNPVTLETVALGRRLFFDPKLSANDTVSCASCHNPLLGFSDGRKISIGFGGKNGKRNAPTVVNAAYGQAQFWDGRASTLEDQAAGPIADPVEMNQTHDVCVDKLRADPTYAAEFTQAFGPGKVTMGKVQMALASFQRTILSGNSPFDRYQYGGEATALSPSAIRGLSIFMDPAKGNCAVCHTVEKKHALFFDDKFHNIGVGVNGEGDLTDLGRFEHTKIESDKGAFKTPTLRNVAASAPYMHDGSMKTLREVVDFYVGGGNSNPYLDKEMKPRNLTANEREDLVAFLLSLTGDLPNNAGPPPTR